MVHRSDNFRLLFALQALMVVSESRTPCDFLEVVRAYPSMNSQSLPPLAMPGGFVCRLERVDWEAALVWSTYHCYLLYVQLTLCRKYRLALPHDRNTLQR